ncbi:DUF5805 domain-containing protein [Haloarcula litorea]|uniref:DUF5805 domain-containing protein n=1 Tax=Haloarcula litorea TaxID=3032579 RepID=UPI0023E84EA4|nr:DUF5805 domain-containing protein [Halomicroarcula sp. GDY20]
MATDGDATEQTSVKTYVPAYQKAEWADHADELDMSQSEFVRTMVQAGRSGFEPVDSVTEGGSDQPAEDDEPGPPDATPGDDTLKHRIEGVLSDGDPHDWDELVSELTDDIEQRLDDALQELQSSGRVRYSGRHGGYVLDE